MADRNNRDKKRKWDSSRILPIVAVITVFVCTVIVFSTNGNRSNRQQATDIQSETGGEISAVIIQKDTASEDSKIDEGILEAPVIEQGDSLVIPIAEISDEASFYPIKVDGEDMEVLAVRATDGTIRTAFNTCQSCYTSGAGFYNFEDGELICNNCGFHFSPDQVEISSGGCNPWPIFDEDKTVTDDSILISYDYLSESKQIFANWKKPARLD